MCPRPSRPVNPITNGASSSASEQNDESSSRPASRLSIPAQLQRMERYILTTILRIEALEGWATQMPGYPRFTPRVPPLVGMRLQRMRQMHREEVIEAPPRPPRVSTPRAATPQEGSSSIPMPQNVEEEMPTNGTNEVPANGGEVTISDPIPIVEYNHAENDELHVREDGHGPVSRTVIEVVNLFQVLPENRALEGCRRPRCRICRNPPYWTPGAVPEYTSSAFGFRELWGNRNRPLIFVVSLATIWPDARNSVLVREAATVRDHWVFVHPRRIFESVECLVCCAMPPMMYGKCGHLSVCFRCSRLLDVPRCIVCREFLMALKSVPIIITDE